MTDMDKIIITEINFRETYNFIFDDQDIRELYQMCPYDVEYNDFYDSMKYNCIKTLFVPDGFEIIKFIPSNVGTLVLNNDIQKIDAKIGSAIAKKAQADGYSLVLVKGAVLYGGSDITEDIKKVTK